MAIKFHRICRERIWPEVGCVLTTATDDLLSLLTCFIATPPDRGWQRNEGLLLLHSFLSLDTLVALSMLRFGRSARSVFVSRFDAVLT